MRGLLQVQGRDLLCSLGCVMDDQTTKLEGKMTEKQQQRCVQEEFANQGFVLRVEGPTKVP